MFCTPLLLIADEQMEMIHCALEYGECIFLRAATTPPMLLDSRVLISELKFTIVVRLNAKHIAPDFIFLCLYQVQLPQKD